MQRVRGEHNGKKGVLCLREEQLVDGHLGGENITDAHQLREKKSLLIAMGRVFTKSQ